MTRKSYILRRAVEGPFVVLAILAVNFFLIKLAPGDPVRMFVSDTYAPPEYVEAMRRQLGLDRPIYEQFIVYLSRLFQGDLGFSFQHGASVLSLIFIRLLFTLLLTGSAFALSVSLGVLLGVIASKKPYSKADNMASSLSLIAFSLPQFWLAIVFLLVFGLFIPIFPAGGAISVGKTGLDYWLDLLYHLLLPAIVLGLSGLASFLRLTRASMLEQLGKDYIMTAWAKGCTERMVLYRHALRNALVPIVTLIGIRLPWLLYGAVLVESVFSWPGLGSLVYAAIFARDYNIIMGIFAVISVLVIVFNLITDILYTYVDPRIAY
jgi:peptide/nickel transport system permease protein